jgi:hypothetical protein
MGMARTLLKEECNKITIHVILDCMFTYFA